MKEYLSIINTVLAFGLHVLTLCFSPVSPLSLCDRADSCHFDRPDFVCHRDGPVLSHVILFLPTTAETHRRRNSSLPVLQPS